MSGPVSGAIMPRMVRLAAEKDNVTLIDVYRKSTQLVSIIAGSVSITMAFCAEPLLWAWTGDKILAHHNAPILILYALGNGILSVSAFPYYLQYAKGDLLLHFIGNAIFLVCLVPLVIWAATQYGAIGAGYVWLGINFLYFLAWIPIVHNKFEPGLNFKWYTEDTLIIFLIAVIACYCIIIILPESNAREACFIKVIITGFIVLFASTAASSEARNKLKYWFHILKNSQ
jgi:O-antigen/teichoic acid export membrane protein